MAQTNISEQVKNFSASHQKQVLNQGNILLEEGMVYMAMRGAANQKLSAIETPDLKQKAESKTLAG